MAHPPTNYLADDIRRIARLHPAEQTAALHDLADRVKRYAAEPAEHELTVSACGLEPEQQMRADALLAASRALPQRDAYADLPDAALPAAVLRLADQFAAYIRDGSPP